MRILSICQNFKVINYIFFSAYWEYRKFGGYERSFCERVGVNASPTLGNKKQIQAVSAVICWRSRAQCIQRKNNTNVWRYNSNLNLVCGLYYQQWLKLLNVTWQALKRCCLIYNYMASCNNTKLQWKWKILIIMLTSHIKPQKCEVNVLLINSGFAQS